MKLEPVEREQAIKLKQLGFNWKVLDFYTTVDKSFYEAKLAGETKPALTDFNDAFWHNRISAPPVALALQWLLKENKLFVWVGRENKKFYFYITDLQQEQKVCPHEGFNSIEQAESYGLDYALQHLLRVTAGRKPFVSREEGAKLRKERN